MGDIEEFVSAESEKIAESEEETETKDYILESPLGDIFHLQEGENKVGRSAGNEVHIPAEKISRHHARLLVSEDDIQLIDLGSTNGSFVNDKKLEKNQPTPLNPGDEIRFGDHSFELKETSK
jgi:pSer/pThr/pTyr-binding forkhead associated (FHA) protein